MNPFQVWIDPLGDLCRVRVDGINNAHWLLARLSREFVFKTVESIREKPESPCCHFNVTYTPVLTRVKFEGLLASIPRVQLSLERTDKATTIVG